MNTFIEQLKEPLLIQCYIILISISFIVCLVIILSSRYGFSRRAGLDELAIQRSHSGFVPRVGGLAIYISLLGLIPLLSFGFIPLSVVFNINVQEVILLILSVIPIFVTGLAEDLGFLMSPKLRILASLVSSLTVIFMFNVWLTELGVPGFDWLMNFAPFGILFTIFATVGVVNAFNLIDGLHGLTSYVSISICVALAVIAFKVDNLHYFVFYTLIIAAVVGFFLLNFPFGKIFLGDCGAYALGHFLVWSAIIMISQINSISPFTILLIFFWPVADTLLTIWRRFKSGNRTDLPDRLHFHQLAMRFLEIRFLGRKKRNIVNPFTTLTLMPLISAPQVIAVLFWDDTFLTILAALISMLLFVAMYYILLASAKSRRV